MSKMYVEKSKIIDAPSSKVFEIINDLKNWGAWSPWLILEPEAKVEVNKGGKFQEWNGARIGHGKLEIISEEQNRSVDCNLTFLKPWKSKAKTRLELTENEGKTTVKWMMDSSLPFFLFWMKKQMIALVGMDYERGLLMLKEYVEKGKVNCQLDFDGENQFEGYQYVGISRKTTVEKLPGEMSKDFEILMKFLEDKPDISLNQFFSQYHKWDFVKQEVEYTSGIGVNQTLMDLPDPIRRGELFPTKVYTLRMTGSYTHLGNAWSAIMSLVRSKTIQTKKGYPPFEVYVNSPRSTPPEDLITEIKMPLK